MARRTPSVIRAERAAKKKKAAATQTKGLTTKQAQRAKITANRKRVEAAKPKAPEKAKKIGTGRWAAKNQAKRTAEAASKKKKSRKSNLRITTWRDLE